MDYSIDNFIKIGASHKICEDYSLCGQIGDVPYIIVSDGCSSSKHTDLGARILCHTAVKVLKHCSPVLDIINYEYLGKSIVQRANLIADTLMLPKSALDATLLIAYIIKNKYRCMMYGDGCYIVGNSKTKTATLTEVSYESNAPFYLSYDNDINPKKHQSYFDIFVDEGRVETVTDLNTSERSTNLYNVKDKFDKSGLVSDGDFILLSTDGIDTFISPTGDKKSTVELTKDLIDFKSCAGEFIRRRTQRVLKNLSVDSMTNVDDFTIAGIYMESDKNENTENPG